MMDEPALRASDAEREHTVERLREGAAEGRLTLEEFTERMSRAYEARTHDELAELEKDLPVGQAGAVVSRRRPTHLLFALFGSTERQGRIRVPDRVTCLMAFGNIDLDLRQATFDGDVITIIALGAFGAIDVYVPEGIDVDFSGLALFGHARARGNETPPRAGTPLVRVVALSLWAGIDVWRVPLAWSQRTWREVIRGIRAGENKELDA